MTSIFRPALVVFAALTLICCGIYPALVTGLGQAIFPQQANGSLVTQDGRVIGSALIGQAFSGSRYFWGRPSATAPMPYNAASSSGSNQGPSNPALLDAVKERVAALRAADPGNKAAIPVDLVTASGSGLDPDISIAGADYQAPRIARERGLPLSQVQELIDAHGTGRVWGVFGEPRVNVLALNLALNRLH